MDDLACREALRAQAWEQAEVACSACVDAPGPAGRFCSGQARWIADRRDDGGGWVGLRGLEEARRTVTFDHQGLLRQPGLSWTVRAELSLLLAARTGALAPLDELPPPPAEAPRDVLARVQLARARGLAEAGRWEEAYHAEHPLAPAGDRPSLVGEIARRRAQERWVPAAWAVALSPALVLPWARPSRASGWGLLPLGLLVGGTWALVEGYAGGAAAALPWALGGWSALHLAAGAALRAGPPRWRAALRGWVALASLAIAYLAFYYTSTLHQVGL